MIKKSYVWQWPDWIPEKRQLFAQYQLYYYTRMYDWMPEVLYCEHCGKPTKWLSGFWEEQGFCTPLCVIAFEREHEFNVSCRVRR